MTPPALERLLARTFRLRSLARLLVSRGIPTFRSSEAYWDERYARGDNSGAGSHGRLAQFKAQVINQAVLDWEIASVIEFGCGDGRQLELAKYPRYLGLDVSEAAIQLCRQRFATDSDKEFRLMQDYRNETAELALSLDVIYHLVEDDIYERYMQVLFAAADRVVTIYSTNTDSTPWYVGKHVKNRQFTRWVSMNAPKWRLIRTRPGVGFGLDFYFYARNDQG